MPTEVYTFRKLGRSFAYTTEPEKPAAGKTDAEAIVAVLEREGVIVKRKHAEFPKPEAAMKAAPPKLKDLTFHEAIVFAREGKKITRPGKAWYLTWLPSLAPHWACIVPGPDGKPEGAHRWPDKHHDAHADMQAHDWKVIP